MNTSTSAHEGTAPLAAYEDAQSVVPGPEPINLRIVVDGATMAGKTTTARSLGAQLGREVFTPEEDEGRTMLFDWLDYEGGNSNGRPLRVQLVTVPGHIPDLRRRLLGTADVILFVADTTAPNVGTAAVAMAELRQLLTQFGEPRPGLMILANKRDAADAVPIDEVRLILGLSDEDLLAETVATSGDGLRQSFAIAVRMALRRAQASESPRVAQYQLTPDRLMSDLVPSAPGGAAPVQGAPGEQPLNGSGEAQDLPRPTLTSRLSHWLRS